MWTFVLPFGYWNCYLSPVLPGTICICVFKTPSKLWLPLSFHPFFSVLVLFIFIFSIIHLLIYIFFLYSSFSALIRPGRFDMQVTVPRPDVKGRTEILKWYLNKIKFDQCKSNSMIQTLLSPWNGNTSMHPVCGPYLINVYKDQFFYVSFSPSSYGSS